MKITRSDLFTFKRGSWARYMAENKYSHTAQVKIGLTLLGTTSTLTLLIQYYTFTYLYDSEDDTLSKASYSSIITIGNLFLAKRVFNALMGGEN